jgi:hypothetical protein
LALWYLITCSLMLLSSVRFFPGKIVILWSRDFIYPLSVSAFWMESQLYLTTMISVLKAAHNLHGSHRRKNLTPHCKTTFTS